jgi:hypothetical protein
LRALAKGELTGEIPAFEYSMAADEIERLRRIESVLDRYFEINGCYPGNDYWGQEFLKASV